MGAQAGVADRQHRVRRPRVVRVQQHERRGRAAVVVLDRERRRVEPRGERGHLGVRRVPRQRTGQPVPHSFDEGLERSRHRASQPAPSTASTAAPRAI